MSSMRASGKPETPGRRSESPRSKVWVNSCRLLAAPTRVPAATIASGTEEGGAAEREATAGQGRDFIGDEETDKEESDYTQYFDASGRLHGGRLTPQSGDQINSGDLAITLTPTEEGVFYADVAEGDEVYARLVKMSYGLYEVLGFEDNDSTLSGSMTGGAAALASGTIDYDISFEATFEGLSNSIEDGDVVDVIIDGSTAYDVSLLPTKLEVALTAAVTDSSSAGATVTVTLESSGELTITLSGDAEMTLGGRQSEPASGWEVIRFDRPASSMVDFEAERGNLEMRRCGDLEMRTFGDL